MARQHRGNDNQTHHSHGHDRRSLFDDRHRAHSERFDRDPGISRSLGSGADVASQSAYRYDGPERRRDYSRPQYESGGYDPNAYRRPRSGSGYGGYGEMPGEGAGGFDSGRNYAAEPGWGPGYGERPEQDTRFGRSTTRFEDSDRGEAFRRQSVGTPRDASSRERGSDHGREVPMAGAGFRARRGPKGYERSDERLREDICERLMWSDDIDASEVSVEVRAGVVMLDGAVPERSMKHAIEDVVDACLGVKDIENRIRVTYGQHQTVHAEGRGDNRDSRVSVGTPSGAGVSGMTDASSAGGSSGGGKSD
jgi:hypothetical protein